jgi:hypothetical protein
MRVKLQLVLCHDDGREETVTDIVSLKKDCHRIEHLGLTLADSKQLLKLIQKKRLQQQVVSKRFCKRQQMQWSKRGAHLLLQARVKTLNREWAAVFKQWYPDIEIEEWDEAA